MSRQRRVYFRGFTMAVLGGLAALPGCTEIFGFERPLRVCHIHSDCPPGEICAFGSCSVQCRDAKLDCQSGQVCLGNVCVEGNDDAGITVADAGVEADVSSDVDANPDAEASLDGSVCPQGCPAFAACGDSLCHQGEKVGPYGGGGFALDETTSDVVTCVQIEISICGYLTGIGMVLHAATDSTFRFALYTDYGGNPTTLLAQTDKVAVSGTTEDAMVGRVVAVGCGDQSVPYWVCWTSSAQGIQLDAIPASSSRWTRITAPTQIATWINSGFPETWPQSNPVELPTPLIYTWVAPLAP